MHLLEKALTQSLENTFAESRKNSSRFQKHSRSLKKTVPESRKHCYRVKQILLQSLENTFAEYVQKILLQSLDCLETTNSDSLKHSRRVQKTLFAQSSKHSCRFQKTLTQRQARKHSCRYQNILMKVSQSTHAESRRHSRSVSKTLTQRLEDTFAESIKYFAQSTTNSDSLKALTQSVKDNHAASRKRSRSVQKILLHSLENTFAESRKNSCRFQKTLTQTHARKHSCNFQTALTQSFYKTLSQSKKHEGRDQKRSMPLMQILENVYADPYKKTHADSRKTPTQSSHIAFAESRKTLCRVQNVRMKI